jgi:geranylgeranyl diphosphate synthase type II
MFLVSLQLGGLTAGADASQQAALERYGRKIGLAFQIADDLLDVEGDEAAMGKRVGKDSEHGKLTFPGLLGVEESRRRAAPRTSRRTLASSSFAWRCILCSTSARTG